MQCSPRSLRDPALRSTFGVDSFHRRGMLGLALLEARACTIAGNADRWKVACPLLALASCISRCWEGCVGPRPELLVSVATGHFWPHPSLVRARPLVLAWAARLDRGPGSWSPFCFTD
jgi:hypothetical protein